MSLAAFGAALLLTFAPAGDRDALLELEEQTHARQSWALGAAWPLAYAATWGEPFEPYDVRAPTTAPVACANVRGMWGAAEPARVPPVSVAWCPDGARARAWPLVAGCAP